MIVGPGVRARPARQFWFPPALRALALSPARLRLAGMPPFAPIDRTTRMAASIGIPQARFAIGDVVRHRIFDFRGIIFDVDPSFANSDEWYEAIPEAMRPSKDQPFYHLLAENAETTYVAYVSQQNLVADESD